MPFEFQRLKIPEVILIIPKIFIDDRGFFFESYKSSEFQDNGITENFVQDNHSKSSKGVLRGLHYQLPPFAQGKLVRCIKGEIFDVAVDIRRTSPFFGNWVGITLNQDNHQMLYIPPGFAHGFYTMENDTEIIYEIIYKVTAEYSEVCDRGILWCDNAINIKWPDDDVILSSKDEKLPELAQAEVFE
jgi:dTDP-4-dehydrorhamnose 3,5-epimerase